MATTTNTGLNQPTYNQTSPTWDQPLNYNEAILDAIFGNTTSIALTNANVTLTGPASSGSLGQTQAMRVTLTGTISANITITIPTGISGRWIIFNNTSGAYTITIASGGGGTTVAAPQGYNITVYSDGTNIRLDNDGILAGGNLTTLNVSGTATFNGFANFVGSTSTMSINLKNIAEAVTVVASAATGTINFDVTTQSVLYYTSASSSNFTLNVRGNSGYSLNALLGTNQAITVVFLNTNGSPAYYNNVLQIDGSTQTVKWANGTAPSSGNASAIDAYTFTIIKTASATYTVIGNLTKFA